MQCSAPVVSHHVHIAFGIQHQPYNLLVALQACHHQRSEATDVLSINLSTVVQQGLPEDKMFDTETR